MRKDIKELFRRHFFPNIPNDKSPGYNIIVIWHFHLQEAPFSLYKIMQLWLSYLLRSLKVEPRASYIFLRSVVQTLQKSRKYLAETWRGLHTSLLKGTLKAYFNWLCISFYYISSGISVFYWKPMLYWFSTSEFSEFQGVFTVGSWMGYLSWSPWALTACHLHLNLAAGWSASLTGDQKSLDCSLCICVTALLRFSANTPKKYPRTLTTYKRKGKELNMKCYEVGLI